MPSIESMQAVLENVISTYEDRIQKMGAIFDATYQILEGFQESFISIQQQKEKVSNQIRDILARNEHLRKKDFDKMMQGVLTIQEERERGVRESLKTYFSEQKEMASDLRNNLKNFKDSLTEGEVQRVKEFQVIIKEILSKQEIRREEVTSMLKEFQKEQRDLAGRMRGLLAKGRDLRIRDLKFMLREFNTQYLKRITRQEERGEEIQKMLLTFNKKRAEWTKSRWHKQKDIA